MEPIFKDDKITLYNADCLDVFPILKEQGIIVDHIITDPPYNVSQKNNFKTMKNKKQGLDFGEWDKDFNQTSWLELATKILNKNASLIIWNQIRNFGIISDELERLGLRIKDTLSWVKYNPMPRNINRRYVVDAEYAIWATKGKWTFNKSELIPYLRPRFFSSLTTKRIHPTQKHTDILSGILEIHTKKGDLILDPFAGSGSIALADFSEINGHINFDNKYILIEKDKNYCLKFLEWYKKIKEIK